MLPIPSFPPPSGSYLNIQDYDEEIEVKVNSSATNHYYLFAAAWNFYILDNGTEYTLTGAFDLYIKPQYAWSTGRRGCWKRQNGGHVWLSICGVTVAGIDPTLINEGDVHEPICTMKSSIGVNTLVPAFSAKTFSINVPHSISTIPIHFECWNNQPAIGSNCGHSGTAGFGYTWHEGPTSAVSVKIPQLPIHRIEYFKGAVDNTNDGTLIDPVTYANTIRLIENNSTHEFTAGVIGTSLGTGHLLTPTIGSSPPWAPIPGLEFLGWKISTNYNPSNYTWGRVAPYPAPPSEPVSRTIRFVAVWGDPSSEFIFDGFPRNKGPEINGPQRDIGGDPTFNFKTPDDKPFEIPAGYPGAGTKVTSGTMTPGRFEFPKDTVLSNFQHNKTSVTSFNGEGWQEDGWSDSYVLPGTHWRFTNAQMASITLTGTARTIIAIYKQDEGTATNDSETVFDANLDTVYPFTNIDGKYDKAILEPLGIGWVPNPDSVIFSDPNPQTETQMPQTNLTIEAPHTPHVNFPVWSYSDPGGGGIGGSGRMQLPPTLPWDSSRAPVERTPTTSVNYGNEGVMPRAGYIFHGWQDAKINGRRYWGRGQHHDCTYTLAQHTRSCGAGDGCKSCVAYWASCPPATEDYTPPCGGGPHSPPCGSGGVKCPRCTLPADSTLFARWERIVNIWRLRSTTPGPNQWKLTAHTCQRNSTVRDVNMLRRQTGATTYVDPFGRYTNFPCNLRHNLNPCGCHTPTPCEHCTTCCVSGNH